MNSFRPRVMRFGDGESTHLEIVEALHLGDGEICQCAGLLTVAGVDLDELRERLEQMLACLGEPIIEASAPHE